MGDLPTLPGVPIGGVCDLPRQVLLSVPGNTIEDVRALEAQLSSVASKKKRRETFKDHVSILIDKNQAEQSTGNPSLKVMDIRTKFIAAKVKSTNGNLGLLSTSNEELNLGQLFS